MKVLTTARGPHVYLLPAIHLLVSLYATVGFYLEDTPAHPVRVWNALTFVDFPVSIVGILLTWGPRWVALAWMVVAGTFWWYFLSLCVRKISTLASVGAGRVENGTLVIVDANFGLI